MDNTLYIPIDTSIKKTVECQKLVKRGETLEFIIRIFTNGALADLTGESADIILIKSDGTRIERTVDSTNIANGTITVKLDQQPSLVAGLVTGEVQIYKDGSLDITNNFTYIVDESLADDIVEISKDDIQVLADLRNLIDKGEITIQKYENLVLAIGNSIEAIEAITNIKSYIDIKLPALENANAQAVVNIENETTANNEATKNIEDLTALNNTADLLNSDLEGNILAGDTLNTDLEVNIAAGNALNSDLEGNIRTGNTLDNDLKADILVGNTLKSDLEADIVTADDKIAAMQAFGDVTQVSQDINNIKTELNNARGTEANLGARLNKFDTSLSESAKQVDLNTTNENVTANTESIDAIALYNATCSYATNVFTLTLANAPTILPNFFTVRVKTPSAWVDGSTIKIGAKTYSVINASFVVNEVVTINFDEVTSTCFFKSGGGGGLTETLPQQVDTFTAIAGDGIVNLTWSNSNTAYLAGYYIVYKTGSYPTTINDGTKIDITAISATSNQITELTNDIQYYFRIFPYNSKKQVQSEYKVATGTPSGYKLLSSMAINAKILVKNDVYLVYQKAEGYTSLISYNALGASVYRSVYNDMTYANSQLKSFLESYAATNYSTFGLVPAYFSSTVGSATSSIRPPLSTADNAFSYSGIAYWTLTKHETVNNYMYLNAGSDDVTKSHGVRAIINININRNVVGIPNANGQYVLV